MPSTISWLDFDTRHNDRMNQILSLFEESGALDELGIGNIRDSFSDLLFPGTSTVQTRLRYFLITAWIYRTLERERVSPPHVAKRVDEIERDLIEVLLAAGERSGVFGRQSGRSLKTLPSTIYWSGLVSWGLVRDISRTEYHRKFDLFWSKSGSDTSAWHHVPEPPAAFPEELDLNLTHAEADYLRSRIALRHKGTALHYLTTAGERPPADVNRVWQHPDVVEFDERTRELVAHAGLFALVNQGANALYNLMLAERRERDDWVQLQRDELGEWGEDVREAGLERWDLERMWQILEPANYNIDGLTRTFVNEWVARVRETDADVFDDATARDIVKVREQRKKGAKSKFKSRSRLDQWNGGARATLLDYRWATVTTFLNDLHDGLEREATDARAV